MTIKDVSQGQRVKVVKVNGEGSLRRHLLDIGLIPDAVLTLVGRAPMGDPVEILVGGYSLTLRVDEASRIEVAPCDRAEDDVPENTGEIDFGYNLTLHEHNSHPGFGEEGKYHSRNDGNPLPKDGVIRLALAGQANCGKTALFNVLTGSNQHVGNFPGVTVASRTGALKGRRNVEVTDLPGMYSMSPTTSEERLARDFILKEKPDAIINVIDAGNIGRSLYLTVQMMALGVPMVVALNMMDEVQGNGGRIRINEMERILGLPVVPVSAARNEGVEELLQHVIHVARYREAPLRVDFCDPEENGGALHRCLHSIMHLVEDHSAAAGLPARFAADKIVEGDEEIMQSLHLSRNEIETIEHIVLEMEAEGGTDRVAAVAGMRYSFIRKLCRKTVRTPESSRSAVLSRKLDRIFTGKWTAVPIFMAVMVSVIWVSVDVIGAPLQALLRSAFDSMGAACGAAMDAAAVSPVIRSLVIDAVFKGVGAILCYVPVIIILFFFLSLLEDSGYMARVAFVTDKLLRKAGLSGRSIVPLLIGFGCSVPAIMAARTLPSARDRRVTILLTPFMSCSAKIPVYAFITTAFFPGYGGLVLVCLYLLGVTLGVITALLSKFIGRRRDAAPFVMELPNYRLPQLRNVGHLLWDRTKDFLRLAFSVILIATIVIWALQSFDWRFNMVSDGEGSMLAAIAGWIEPLFEPLGLGDWRIVTSLISGFMAKESIVVSMELLNVLPTLSLAAVVPLLVFILLYSPCVASIASVRRELGRWWALYVVVFQCAVAWVAAYLAYQIALLAL